MEALRRSLAERETQAATAKQERSRLEEQVDDLQVELQRSEARGVESLRAVEGRGVYARYCATCHGGNGDGEGPTARFLGVRPRDFTTGSYKWRTTPTGALPTDGDIERTIARGVPGTPMPQWSGKLTESQIGDVVAYIKGFSERFVEEADEEVELVRVPDDAPLSTPQSVARGRSLYLLMQCWNCHGFEGTGDGPASETLTDDEGRPIRAYDFTSGRLKSGGRPQDVFRTFSTGVNGTPMPSYHEALMVGRDAFVELPLFEGRISRSEEAALRAYIATLPTTKEIYSKDEAGLEVYAATARWSLVHYVLSLVEQRAGLARTLFDDPYLTD